VLGENVVSPLRIGRDGRLYQLRTDIRPERPSPRTRSAPTRTRPSSAQPGV